MQATRGLVGSRLRSLTVLIGFLGAGPLAGCHRREAKEAGEVAPNRTSVKRSLDGLERQVGQLESNFAALRKQIEAVSPELPGFSQIRAQFYSTEEARGITDAKVKLIANRLASTAGSGSPEDLRKELQKISKDIAETYDEVRQIDELHTSLSSRLHALEGAGGRSYEAITPHGSASRIVNTR